jgi:hypothetical protein
MIKEKTWIDIFCRFPLLKKSDLILGRSMVSAKRTDLNGRTIAQLKVYGQRDW